MTADTKINQKNKDPFFEMLHKYPMTNELKTFVKGFRDQFHNEKSDKKVEFLLEKSIEMVKKLDTIDETRTRKIMFELLQLYNNRIAGVPLADKEKAFDKKSVEIIEEIQELKSIRTAEKAGIIKIFIGFINETHLITPEFKVQRVGNGEDARFVRKD